MIKKLSPDNKGNAALSMVVSMPFLFLFILFLVTVIQIGLARQSVEYAAYAAARAAVMTGNRDDAKSQAQQIATDTLTAGTFGIRHDAVEVIITPVSGAFSDPGNMFESIKWEKGTIIKCEVIVTLETMMIGEITLASNITMMIERPAPDYWNN